MRVVSETLDENGNVANVIRTETKTTLVAADAQGYSLRIESTVEVAGKRFASQPQVVKHGYYGETAGQTVTVKKLDDEDVVIAGRTVPSEVRLATIEADGVKRISKIYYASQVSPYQLQRETTTEGVPEEQAVRRSSRRSRSSMPSQGAQQHTAGCVCEDHSQEPSRDEGDRGSPLRQRAGGSRQPLFG